VKPAKGFKVRAQNLKNLFAIVFTSKLTHQLLVKDMKTRIRSNFKQYVFLLLLIIILFTTMMQVTADPATTISVEPSSIIDETKEPGSSFSVDIVITDVTDLGGYEFKLSYDTSVLSVIRVVVVNETDFFYESYVWTKRHKDAEGYIWLVVTLPLGTLQGVDGTGTVVTIDFTVDDLGETVLDLYDTKLGTPLVEPITHEAIDGIFDNFPDEVYPVASFTFSPTLPVVDQTVTFNASTSYDADGSITDYNWLFGDGATDSGMVVDHTFSAAGTYTVNLTVTDNDGLTRSEMGDVEVIPPAIHDVAIISITSSQSSVTAGEEVSITVTVKNEGNRPETFGVAVLYDSQAAAVSQTVSNLEADAERTLTFNWDTSDVEPGSYTLKASASRVVGETDEADNSISGDSITVNEAPSGMPDMMLYVVVAAVIIALAGVAVYLVKGRKS